MFIIYSSLILIYFLNPRATRAKNEDKIQQVTKTDTKGFSSKHQLANRSEVFVLYIYMLYSFCCIRSC